MRNRLTLLLTGLALAVASGTAAAHSSVSFGISLGVPVAPAPVYYSAPPAVYYEPAPVYYAPAPRVYYAPAYYGPPAVVIRGHRGHHHRDHWR
jgi:hypothetical protein